LSFLTMGASNGISRTFPCTDHIHDSIQACSDDG
jgi:hypothetical protein